MFEAVVILIGNVLVNNVEGEMPEAVQLAFGRNWVVVHRLTPCGSTRINKMWYMARSNPRPEMFLMMAAVWLVYKFRVIENGSMGHLWDFLSIMFGVRRLWMQERGCKKIYDEIIVIITINRILQ